MSTHSVAGTCKLCGKSLVLKVDDEYPWPIEGLLDKATCNRCYDIRDKREKAKSNIRNMCIWLSQRTEISADKQKQTAERLKKWTKDYTEAIAAQNNASIIVWSEEMAENLMKQPQNWHEQLEFYDNNVQRHAQLAGISP